MAIVVDKDTRLLVQGLTGSEGRFHGLRNRNYGTNVVAGVTPGKGGQDVEGIPVFNTVADSVAEAGANTTLIFVPARFATDAIYEAVDAGIGTLICITEHIPAHDMLLAYTYIRGNGVTMIGPNCPGVLSPGKANVGIIPAEIFSEGSIGLVSRSGTLTYQIGHELTQLSLGNSTIVGIGGDPVVGSSFIEVLRRFRSGPRTRPDAPFRARSWARAPRPPSRAMEPRFSRTARPAGTHRCATGSPSVTASIPRGS